MLRCPDRRLSRRRHGFLGSLAIFCVLCYDALMTERTGDNMAFAMPTGEDTATWNALSREEQLARLRKECAHPDCDVVVDDSMADILALAKERVARKQHARV
jgi:hypothetical protein